jgi:carbon monoxide dehydrogenase subunit G
MEGVKQHMGKTDNAAFIDALGEEAKEQLSEIRAARTYRGNNPEYAKRAKMAIGVIGSYVRLRATLANERSNELVAIRLVGGGGSGQKALVESTE